MLFIECLETVPCIRHSSSIVFGLLLVPTANHMSDVHLRAGIDEDDAAPTVFIWRRFKRCGSTEALSRVSTGMNSLPC